MKKYTLIKLIICSFVVGILFTGCAIFDDEPKAVTKKEVSVAPTQGLDKLGNPEDAGKKMIDSILKGISTDNYALYSRDFTAKNKKYFDKKVFDQAHDAVKDKLGEYKGVKFIGFWKKGEYDIILWKARFTKTEDDVLIQMYITKVDKTYKIAALKLI